MECVRQLVIMDRANPASALVYWCGNGHAYYIGARQECLHVGKGRRIGQPNRLYPALQPDGVEVDQHQGDSVFSDIVPVCDQMCRQRSSYSSSSARIVAISAAISSSVIGWWPRCCWSR